MDLFEIALNKVRLIIKPNNAFVLGNRIGTDKTPLGGDGSLEDVFELTPPLGDILVQSKEVLKKSGFLSKSQYGDAEWTGKKVTWVRSFLKLEPTGCAQMNVQVHAHLVGQRQLWSP